MVCLAPPPPPALLWASEDGLSVGCPQDPTEYLRVFNETRSEVFAAAEGAEALMVARQAEYEVRA